jgi:2-oxoglutarate ferredoxin oxidoreductase subunit gamma
MKFHYEIRLCGDVGQGLLIIGKILAEAAAIYDGHNAIQSQSYGEEARGEANRSEVIISNQEILSPKVENPDLLLCLSQVAYQKYGNTLKKNGVLVIDSSRVLSTSDIHRNLYDFPIFNTAKKQADGESEAIILALGIITRLIKPISLDAVRKALKTRIPKGKEEINEKYLELGYQMAHQKIKSHTKKKDSLSPEETVSD